MGSTFGQLFRISTWGESHGGGVGVVVDGCPPLVPLTEAEIQIDGKTVCNADITFRVVDFPEGDFLANMHEVARRIDFPMESVAHG